jgi:hypothetical protein
MDRKAKGRSREAKRCLMTGRRWVENGLKMSLGLNRTKIADYFKNVTKVVMVSHQYYTISTSHK